jgi:uncharacterized protein
MILSRLLETVVIAACRRAWLTMAVGLLLALLCLGAAYERLGVTTDTDLLFSDSLPWRQQDIAFNKDFPQFKDLLVLLVDGQTPEIAEQTAADLARAMARDPKHFRDVTRPDALPYLEKNGLLFLDPKPLGDLLDQTVDAQPFLGKLAADPSARGLFGALSLIGLGLEKGQADLSGYAPSLAAFHRALAGALAGKPAPLSWENLLAGSLAAQAGQYRFVLAHPALDYAALEPGGDASDAARALIGKLEFVRDGLARVRLTGDVALSDEEFSTVAQGAATGTIGSLALVLLWLILAVRSWRLIVPILLCLLLGLIYTTGFAAIAVGTLNLVSVAFAVLFIGIAVDFAIQFCVRAREMRLSTGDEAAALEATARVAGPQILVAALATAAGFLAFVPTDFSGVAELGLIAGGGMVIAFLCSIVFLPAMLSLCHPRPESQEVGFRWARRLERILFRRRPAVLTVAGLIFIAGLALAPRLVFDSDPLHTKDPNTEAMRALSDMMDDPLTNPYSIDIVEPNQATADAVAERLRKLPLVSDALTLSSFVPDDQKEKLGLLQDAADALSPSLAAPDAAPGPVTPAAIRAAAAAALAQLESGIQAAKDPAQSAPIRPLLGDLRALATAPDDTVMAVNAALTRFLPLQLDRLRAALSAQRVTADDIPPELSRDWRLPDGRARVQVLSRASAHDSQGLHDFVAQVRSVAPNAGGTAVVIVETAKTIVGAFRTAALGAVIAIAILLLIVLRRVLDAALVLGALLLSATVTVLAAVLLPLPLNFANIIALPLLLGVGVSFNIYFVMNWRQGTTRFLGTATARAVLFSALTTGTAFSSLALSAHPGTASMGELLLISLGATLAVTWLVLPALLSILPHQRRW